ncbi:hypothetical protein QYM36_014702, partial [Artemia franciscana]
MIVERSCQEKAINIVDLVRKDIKEDSAFQMDIRNLKSMLLAVLAFENNEEELGSDFTELTDDFKVQPSPHFLLVYGIPAINVTKASLKLIILWRAAKELQKYKVTIAGITETHPSADCEEYIGEVRTLVWRSPEMRRCCAARKSLLSFAPVKPRLLRARFDSKHGRINIITCYALTNETEEEDKSDFYTLLSFELSSVPPHDYLILLGDMNNSISNESGMWDFAVGPVTVDSLSDNR